MELHVSNVLITSANVIRYYNVYERRHDIIATRLPVIT